MIETTTQQNVESHANDRGAHPSEPTFVADDTVSGKWACGCEPGNGAWRSDRGSDPQAYTGF